MTCSAPAPQGGGPMGGMGFGGGPGGGGGGDRPATGMALALGLVDMRQEGGVFASAGVGA